MVTRILYILSFEIGCPSSTEIWANVELNMAEWKYGRDGNMAKCCIQCMGVTYLMFIAIFRFGEDLKNVNVEIYKNENN